MAIGEIYRQQIFKMTKEELKAKVDLLTDEVDKLWNESFNRPDGWEWYKNHPKLKELIETNRDYKLVQDVTLDDMEELDKECRMTMKDFIECAKSGCLCNSDGSGYYATSTQVSRIPISPSDIMANKYRKDFDYVCWYNK